MEILCAALSTETSELLCLSKTHGRLHLAAVFDARSALRLPYTKTGMNVAILCRGWASRLGKNIVRSVQLLILCWRR